VGGCVSIVKRRWLHWTTSCKDVVIKMPALSPTMSTGTIVKWLKKEGDQVTAGDVLCEIQTDKAVVAMELDEEGTLARILVPADSKDIAVGRSIAVMAESGEDWNEIRRKSSDRHDDKEEKEEKEEKSASDAKTTIPSSPNTKPGSPTTTEDHHNSTRLTGPAVRLLLQQYGLNASYIRATGPKHNILKSDILQLIASKQLKPSRSPLKNGDNLAKVAKKETPSPSQGRSSKYDDIALPDYRVALIDHLMESKKKIPHAYISTLLSVDKAMSFCQTCSADGIKVSVEDLLVKAVSSALVTIPEVNVEMLGEELRQRKTVDIAITLNASHGVFSPILENVDRLGVIEIAHRLKDFEYLEEATYEGKRSGSLTITNFDDLQILQHTSVIRSPQVAVVTVGEIKQQMDEAMTTKTSMNVTLCYDARAISERDASRFLAYLRQSFDEPDTLLLSTFIPTSQRDEDESQTFSSC